MSECSEGILNFHEVSSLSFIKLYHESEETTINYYILLVKECEVCFDSLKFVDLFVAIDSFVSACLFDQVLDYCFLYQSFIFDVI